MASRGPPLLSRHRPAPLAWWIGETSAVFSSPNGIHKPMSDKPHYVNLTNSSPLPKSRTYCPPRARTGCAASPPPHANPGPPERRQQHSQEEFRSPIAAGEGRPLFRHVLRREGKYAQATIGSSIPSPPGRYIRALVAYLVCSPVCGGRYARVSRYPCTVGIRGADLQSARRISFGSAIESTRSALATCGVGEC